MKIKHRNKSDNTPNKAEKTTTRAPWILPSVNVANVIGEISGLGIKIPEKDEFSGDAHELPQDLTKYSSKALGKLLSEFTAKSGFLEWEVSKADVINNHIETNMDILYNQLLLTVPGSTAYEKKARVMKNPQYMEVVQKKLTAHAKYKLLSSLLRRYEKYCATISREISRRDSDFKRTQN